MPTLCRGCGRSITGSYITVGGSPWHEDCFKCAGCGRTIGKQSYYEKDGRPYHESCYQERFSPRCADCGRPVTGRYTTALGKSWHPEHFRCARCNRPFEGTTFVERDGKAYCQRDYEDLFCPRCADCGKPIVGRCTTALGKTWHPAHFRCARCKGPFDGTRFYEHDGKAYCKRDYEDLFGLRCAGGGELIQGHYFEKDGNAYCDRHYWELFGKRCAIGGEILKGQYRVNSWGDTFCNEHAGQVPECFSCHRPICQKVTGGGVRYGDDRAMCNLCRRTAVEDDASAQRLLDDVRKRLAGCGIAVPPSEITAHLVDQADLVRRNTHGGKPPSGMMLSRYQTTSDGRETGRWVDGILVLYGLPAEHFRSVVAHELMHCYLWLSQYPKLSRKDEEGLCELVEWLWLQERRDPLSSHLAKATEAGDDAIYGAGFRAARAAYDRVGLERLLAEVKKNARLR